MVDRKSLFCISLFSCMGVLRLLQYLEEAHPTQLGKLALVGMEHVEARLETGEGKLENAALRLALHDRVHGLQRWLQRRAVIVVVVEVAVNMQGIDRIE